VQNAPTTLKQAVAIAEQKAGGKAAEAEIEREASTVRYKITVMTGSQSQEITVGVQPCPGGEKPGRRATARRPKGQVRRGLSRKSPGGAEIEREASTVRYKITVMTGSQSQEITVGADGKIVPNK
jgi:uncharacterized membrane protein YkoI